MSKEISTYEIRVCTRAGCGLRFPILSENLPGERCPRCRAGTRVVLRRDIHTEPEQTGAPAPTGLPLVILDNLRSAWNVGAIFRTADGLGVKHLMLTGITPTPETAAVRKTALGAEQAVPWSYHPDALEAGREYIDNGGRLWGLEIMAGAQSLFDKNTTNPGCLPGLVVGNEICGVDPELLMLCEEIVYLPMAGGKRSLNVAVSFGVAAYQLTYSLNRS